MQIDFNISKVSMSSQLAKSYKCSFAGCKYGPDSSKSFSKSKYLKQHVDKVHAEKIHTCSACQKGFGSSQLLATHSKGCGKSFPCDSCEKTYTSYEALLTHLKRNKHSSALQTPKRKSLLPSETPIIILFPQPLSNPSDAAKTVFKPSIPSILPKPSALHLMAAMALSELASSGEERFRNVKSVVDIGTQTDGFSSSEKRKINKSSKKERSGKFRSCKLSNHSASSTTPHADPISSIPIQTDDTGQSPNTLNTNIFRAVEQCPGLFSHTETQTSQLSLQFDDQSTRETQTIWNRGTSVQTQTFTATANESLLSSASKDTSKDCELGYQLSREQEDNSLAGLTDIWGDDMDEKATAATQTEADPFLRQGLLDEQPAGGVLLSSQTQTCYEEDLEFFNAVNLNHMETQTNWNWDPEQNGGFVDSETQTALSAVWWRELGPDNRGLYKQSSSEDTGTDPMEQIT